MERRRHTAAAPSPAVRKQALEALIDRQVLLDEAIRNKIDRDPKVIQIVDRLRTQAIVQAYLESKAANVATASKAEMDAYFDAHPELFAASQGAGCDAIDGRRKRFQRTAQGGNGQGPIAGSGCSVATGTSHRLCKKPALVFQRRIACRNAGQAKRTLDRSRLFVMQDKDGGQAELCVLNDVRDSPVSRDAASAQIERYLLNKKMQDVAAAEVTRLRASAKLVYVEALPTMMVEEDTGAAANTSASTLTPVSASTSAPRAIAESR